MNLINYKYLIDFVGSFIATIIISLTYSNMTNNKFSLDYKKIIIISLSSLLMVINIYNNITVIKTFTSFLILLVTFLLLYRNSLTRTIFNTLICYIVGIIVEIVLSILIVKFDILNLEEYNDNSIIKAVFSIINMLITFLLLNIEKIRININKLSIKFEKNNIIMSIFIISLVALFIFDFKYSITFSQKIYLSNLVLIICILLLIGIILYNSFRISKEVEKTDSLLNFVSKYEKIIDEDRVNRHELLNNLLSLKTIKNKNSKEFEKSLDELINSYNSNALNIKNIYKLPSGLKGIFYYKLNGLEEEGFNINISISKRINNKIEKLDNKEYMNLCRIVGILLDNAIDASRKTMEKFIGVEVYKEKESTIIVIDNSFEGKIDLDQINNKNYSTNGSGRGLGLYILKNTIKKIDNMVFEQSINNNLFTSKIIVK